MRTISIDTLPQAGERNASHDLGSGEGDEEHKMSGGTKRKRLNGGSEGDRDDAETRCQPNRSRLSATESIIGAFESRKDAADTHSGKRPNKSEGVKSKSTFQPKVAVVRAARSRKMATNTRISINKTTNRPYRNAKYESVSARRRKTKREFVACGEPEACTSHDIKNCSFMKRRVQDRRNYARPKDQIASRNVVKTTISAQASNKDCVKHLRWLLDKKANKPTPEQMERLEEASVRGPHYLTRTNSFTGGHKFGGFLRRTNGFTTQSSMLPAADTHENQAAHDRLGDMSEGEIQFIGGNRLLWKDRPDDQFLSYSSDPHLR